MRGLRLVSTGVGQVAGSLGVAKAWHWWDRLARRRREEAPRLLASSEQCLCFLSLFSICLAPAAFQASPDCVQGDKRADEQEISGGSGVTQHRHDGGGWMAKGGPGRGIGLTTSCTERFSEGTLHTALRLIPATLGAKHEGLRFTEEKTETQKAQPGMEPWPLGFPISHAALGLTPLAMRMTPGLVKPILPLHLEVAIFRLFMEKESKGPARVSTTNTGGACPARVPTKSLICSWSLGGEMEPSLTSWLS